MPQRFRYLLAPVQNVGVPKPPDAKSLRL
jgi:hypothetical protein